MIDLTRIQKAIEESGATVPAVIMLVDTVAKNEADALIKIANAEARAVAAEANAMTPEASAAIDGLVAHLEEMTKSMKDTLAKYATENPTSAPTSAPETSSSPDAVQVL
jgi:hypothetical protein